MNRLQAAYRALMGKKALPMQGARVAVVNGQLVWSTDNDEKIIKNGYLANDIVYSIIALIENKVKLASWATYKVVEESSLKLYKSCLVEGRFAEAWKHRRKALELYTGDAKLNELLRYPNEAESWADLIGQATGYKLLTGDKFLWAELLQGGANTGKPQSIHVLPAHLMQIIATRTFPVMEAGYQINYGYIKTFSKEEVLHEKYWNPQWDTNGQQLYGLSPLRAACKNIDRNNSAKEASTKKFRNGGAEGVLYQDDDKLSEPDLAEEQIGALEKSWNEKYGGPKNAGKIVLSGYKVGWAKIGLSPVDMQIIDSEKWDLRMLCAIYGVPSQLLNDPDNKTYNSLREAEKALTSRCAIPELVATRESLNRKLQTDWGYKGKNIFLDFDTSVYPELQENEADKAAWMSKGPLTIRQWYDLREIEIPEGVTDEVLDTMLVPSNLVDVNSLGLTVPDIGQDASDLSKMRML